MPRQLHNHFSCMVIFVTLRRHLSILTYNQSQAIWAGSFLPLKYFLVYLILMSNDLQLIKYYIKFRKLMMSLSGW